MKLDRDWMTQLEAEWVAEGRSEEQIYGVRNFLSGKGEAIRTHMTAERIDELNQVNKVNNSIYSDDPAAYYVKIQRHVNNRLAALEQRQEGE